MCDNKLRYGFDMNTLDDARSFASLWSGTRDFITAHSELIHPEADPEWLLDPETGYEYDNCRFFSNFETGDLRVFHSKENEKYFDWLDKHGGFHYERFGDAPIHMLSAAMFAPKRQTWLFCDIGYQHDINR
jgi:alpha 1,2-mannosyltransferase